MIFDVISATDQARVIAMNPSDDEPKTIPCPDCGGTGKIPARLDNLPGPTPFLEIDCPTCNGTGRIREPDC
jgi:DnaJ-class molecular chaperone